MKHIMTVVPGFVLTLALGALFWPGHDAQAQAQRGPRLRVRSTVGHTATVQPSAQAACKPFAGVAQATLPTSTPVATTDTWGGPLFALLGGELLGPKAVLSGNDGDEAWYEDETLGTGRGGQYTVCLNHPTCSDTFTIGIPVAVFPIPSSDLGTYLAYNVTIVKGTGKFAAATGDLKFRGTFIAWPDDSSPIGISGRWYPEIWGTICGIQ